MARTKFVKEEGVTRWRKVKGKGSFRLRSGKIIKPNQVFDAKEVDIPDAFIGFLEKVDSKEVPVTPSVPIGGGPRVKRRIQEEEEDLDFKPSEFEAVEGEEGAYSVRVKSTGKIITEKALTREEAFQLVEDLES